MKNINSALRVAGEISSRPGPRMQTVGIITNYANINYGSILQSYALQQTLKSIGFKGENIQWFVNVKRSWLYRSARLGYRFFGDFFSPRSRRVAKFQHFRQQYIRETKNNYASFDNLASLNEAYDAFICGSDQIWAPNQFHERYYLNFVNDNKCKIAYAPSIGLPRIPETLKLKIAGLVNRIDHLSVREQAGATIVKELTGRDASVVLDPTMLLDRQEWLKVAAGNYPGGDYILCYFLGDNKNHRRAAESWKKKTGWRIVVLPFKNIDDTWGDVRIADAGPEMFLALIDGARWVFTDSFHGMAFSIIMNKPFSAFLRFMQDEPLCQNSRIEHLLGRFGLMNRIVTAESMDAYTPGSIDYTPVNKKVADERNHSIQYLKNALGEGAQT